MKSLIEVLILIFLGTSLSALLGDPMDPSELFTYCLIGLVLFELAELKERLHG